MKSLPIVIDSRIRIRVRDLETAGIQPRAVLHLAEHPNPDFHKKRAMGFWTGNVPKILTLASQEDGWVCLPRGLWRPLSRLLASRGVGTKACDRTRQDTHQGAQMAFRAPFDLDPDQAAAVDAVVRGRQGLVLAPCGAGKTVIAMAAAAQINEKTLILVHTDRLLKRWVPDLQAMMSGVSVGEYSGRRKTDGDVVVGMMQSVGRIKDKSWIDRFGCMVVDEAHHAPCKTMTSIVGSARAKWRVGLTATPKRRDGTDFYLEDLFGTSPDGGPRVLARITDADLDRHGRIVPVRVVVVPTEFTHSVSDPGKSGVPEHKWYHGMVEAMVADRSRTALIRRHLEPQIAGGKPCLVLADRRELCRTVADELRARGVRCGLMLGGPKDRKEADRTEAGLHSGEIQVAVGTTVADEGLDIKRIEVGAGLTPVARNAGRFTQQVGRFKRVSPGKESATYFYLWDRKVPRLLGHARATLNAVKPPHTVWYARGVGDHVPLTQKLLKQLENEVQK